MKNGMSYTLTIEKTHENATFNNYPWKLVNLLKLMIIVYGYTIIVLLQS